jgi:hypothetical protein
MAQVLHGWRGLDVAEAEAEAVDVTRVPVEPTIVLDGMTRPSKAGLTALRRDAQVAVAKRLLAGDNHFRTQQDYESYFACEIAKEMLRLIEREFPPETHWKEDVP